MRKTFPYILSILISALTWITIYSFLDGNKFIAIYNDRLQYVFFTAFLTVGSLLLAMKAFLLVRLKDDIYLHEEYQKRYQEQCNGPHKIDYFQGLKDMGYLLVVSVIVCFLTSIAQVTIGFCPMYEIKIIAPSLAAGVLALVIIDWLFVFLNLRDWFTFIEADIQNKLKKGNVNN